MAQYPDALLSDIRAAVDIVDHVGRFVNLRKAGVNWKGLCPFHVEKTPSFMVNPRKGIFHCFGCGVGGDVFNFMMRQDRVSFPEAVRALVEWAFSHAEVKRVTAQTLPELRPSIRVLEKCGFRFTGPGMEEGAIGFERERE